MALKSLALFAALLAQPMSAAAQDIGPINARGCVDASRPGTTVTMVGKLTVQLFAGPPNYESIADGDAEERAFILELPRSICFTDAEFADGSERFDRVHVSADDAALVAVLRAGVGRTVVVSGEAFGAHTGHHRAPMVLFAKSITVR